MAEMVLYALMVILMIVAPPTFMFGLAIREQRLRVGAADLTR
ncbi:hypothetical protein LJR225_001730 [Phenylobacterium sp. LjRoot225]